MLSLSHTTPIVALLVLATITPGPNNLILLQAGASSKGARMGWRLGSGVVIGGCAMLAVMGVAADVIAGLLESAAIWLAVGAALMLIGLAVSSWRNAVRPVPALPGHRLGFWGMTAFQWINPKGWALMASLAALATTMPGSIDVWPILGLFAAISALASLLWFHAGRALRRWIGSSRRRCFVQRACALVLGMMAVLQLREVLA